MNNRSELEKHVFMAARDQGISSVLFRNVIGRRLGLTITDWECLSLLTIKGVATPKELAQFTGLTSGSTTAMLDRLERAGLITRKPNPNDRRGVLIEVNADSDMIKHSKELVGPIQKAHFELISTFADEELKTIAAFLNGFSQNVKNQTKQLEKNN